MTQITAAMVKELRERTNAGMMDCKKALNENNGDMEASVDWLRQKGLASAAKKASRVASEGLVGAISRDNQGAVIEVNAETDFVARNADFSDFVLTVTGLALESADNIEALMAAPYPEGSGTVQEKLTDLVATIGENMGMRRMQKLSVSQGVVGSYVHSAVAPGIGRIGVLVALESTGDKAKLEELAKQLCMHVAASSPLAATVEELDPEEIEREKTVFAEQAKESGKPDDIIAKMVEGRLRKFYEEVVLNEQSFIMDTDKKIKDVIAEASKEMGAPVTLKGFVRYNLGEGIEKEEKDFASEVAAQLATA